MEERNRHYLGFGVRYLSLIHTGTRRAFAYTARGVRQAKDSVPCTDEPGICVPLSELE